MFWAAKIHNTQTVLLPIKAGEIIQIRMVTVPGILTRLKIKESTQRGLYFPFFALVSSTVKCGSTK